MVGHTVAGVSAPADPGECAAGFGHRHTNRPHHALSTTQQWVSKVSGGHLLPHPLLATMKHQPHLTLTCVIGGWYD